MRKGRRKALAALWFLLGTTVAAAPPAPPMLQPPQGAGAAPVRLTVEVSWRVSPSPAPPVGDDSGVDLELTEGRVVDALAWPSPARGGPRRQGRGWRLGSELSGRVRARLEAPVGASLLFRVAGQAVRMPILSVLDGPQRLSAQPGLEIAVERLSWDAIAVGLEQGDGTVAPGAVVPVSVGFNVLTPEPTEVALSGSFELIPHGGGEPLWRQDFHEVVASNASNPPAKVWSIPAPPVEGTYVLEIRTEWQPLAGLDGTRVLRWIRRKRNPATATSVVRRVALSVVDPRRSDGDAAGAGIEREVEVIDLARLRGQRPSASGRSPALAPGGMAWPVPEAALVEAPRRDRLRGWITHAGSETAVLPPAEPAGLAWSALGLKVPSPGRPHRLTLTVTGGHPSALGVAMVDSGGPRGRARVLLDACASGPPILEGGPVASFSWLVWPDDADPVLVLVNRDPVTPVRLGAVALTELGGLPAPPVIIPPSSASDARGLGLYLPAPELLDRFGGGSGPADPLALARNLSSYLAYCGASSVVLPEGLADRSRRRALDGQAAEDPAGPDRLELLLRILARQGQTAWIELAPEAPLPGLPPAESSEALARGLVRVDRHGHADGPAYHPLHPEVRDALKRRVAEAASPRKSHPALAGLVIRLGPGPTLLGAPDTGLDDATFARFVRETFAPEAARTTPGLGTTDPDRFAARSRFVAGPGRMPWLTWRAAGIASLYAELSKAARHAAPGMILAVATPGLDDGPAGAEARRVDLAAGPPGHAWRAVGLDLETWPAGDDAPVVLRGVGLSNDPLALDLATNPELDAPVVARPGRGLLVGDRHPPPLPRAGGDSGLRLTALPLPEGATGDELLGHALAALDARWVMLGSSAVAGHEERIRRFAQVLRALPASAAAGAPLDRQPFGVAVRPIPSGSSTFLSLANDTPYPVRVETILESGSATVDDLGRNLRLAPETAPGGRRLVLDLLPFGVGAIRVASAQVKVGPVTPYPSEAVMTGMKARYDELSAQFSRLSRAGSSGQSGPPNPGFEPSSTPLVQLTGASSPPPPGGWQVVEGGATLEIDSAQVHSGRGSLRIESPAAPAAILSDEFPVRIQSAAAVQAWFRADRPDAKVRLWIEGVGSNGQQLYRRWSEIAVTTEWRAHGLWGSELPPGGLEAARVRLELLTPGRIWVDDLRVSGDAPTESERQNTRRVLLAALQAYNEKRYADFARLAGSHWARSPAVAGPRGSEPTAAESAEMIRTGRATALPQNRVLR